MPVASPLSFWFYLSGLVRLGTFNRWTYKPFIATSVRSYRPAPSKPYLTEPRRLIGHIARIHCDSSIPPGLSYHTYPILVAYLLWLGVVERRCTFTHICNRRQSETCKALFNTG